MTMMMIMMIIKTISSQSHHLAYHSRFNCSTQSIKQVFRFLCKGNKVSFQKDDKLETNDYKQAFGQRVVFHNHNLDMRSFLPTRTLDSQFSISGQKKEGFGWCSCEHERKWKKRAKCQRKEHYAIRPGSFTRT